MGNRKRDLGRGGGEGNWRLRLIVVMVVLLTPQIIQPSNALTVYQAKKKVVMLMDRAWDEIRVLNKSNQTPESLLKVVGKSMEKITAVIGRIEREMLIYEYDEALQSLSKVKNTSVAWPDKWSEIAVLTSPVDVIYGHLVLFSEMPAAFVPDSGALDFDANTLTELILKPLYNADSKGPLTLKYLIENAHSAVVSKVRGRKNAFTLLSKHIDEALQLSYWCLWNAKTPERLVYGLYTKLSLLDVKEFALINFAYMLRYALNKTDPGIAVLKDLKISLETRFVEKAASAKNTLSKVSNAYWRCDPIKYERGKTYEEFQELLQGYIENEKNMHHGGSCKQTCTDYNFVQAYCPYPDKDTCLQQRVCTGDLVECKFVAADSSVCPAAAPRRYDYIQYKKGPIFGNTSARCKQDLIRKDSFWRFLYHCSNCFCLCDDAASPTTYRHVNLVPAISDIGSNQIVTGIRFAMENGVLHLQIQEGEPATDGLIVDQSTTWKKLANIDKQNRSQAVILGYTQRGFDLDDLLVPPNHVLTGVRFRTLGSHINLEIQGTQINPDTGNLIPDTSHWISNDNTPESVSEAMHSREELVIEDPDVPTRTTIPSVPDSAHNQFIQFGPSSYVKDVAQTTVPYIDIQDVIPKPAVWLAGIGIYHKGQVGYGGFIAPKIYTHSAANHIQIDDYDRQ